MAENNISLKIKELARTVGAKIKEIGQTVATIGEIARESLIADNMTSGDQAGERLLSDPYRDYGDINHNFYKKKHMQVKLGLIPIAWSGRDDYNDFGLLQEYEAERDRVLNAGPDGSPSGDSGPPEDEETDGFA